MSKSSAQDKKDFNLLVPVTLCLVLLLSHVTPLLADVSLSQPFCDLIGIDK